MATCAELVSWSDDEAIACRLYDVAGVCPVHCKSASAQEARVLLSARKLLLNKLIEIEHGLLRGFRLKMGKVGRGRFVERVRELVGGHPMLEHVAAATFTAGAAVQREMNALDARALVRDDATCRRLVSVPCVRALTFHAAVDDPARFSSSKRVGTHFGLVPRKHQSGETGITGAITRTGDAMVRAMLDEAAQALLLRVRSSSALNMWALAVARRRGRQLAGVLHRIWIDGTTFEPRTTSSAAFA